MTFVSVVLAVSFVVVVAVAALALAAQSWLRRWQVDLLRRHEAATEAALSTVRSSSSAQVAATVDTVLAVAADKLGAQVALGTQHVELRNSAIEQTLAGMADELRRVNGLVLGLQKERAEQHGQLISGLAEHARQSAELAATAHSLRSALSSPKSRGQWGERMAEDVLRLAGMVEGVNYRRQASLPGGTIPDFTFLLPGGRCLHMDVKFPMDNYLRMLAATAEVERSQHATAFGRDVRSRVRELAGRGYIDRATTLDFMIAFIPNEAVYGFIHEQDPALVDDALRQRIVLCSPFTLFAVLAVVRQSVEHAALERTSDELLAVLGGFGQQWERFAESLDGLGRKLETTSRAYEELAGPRRRQLQRQLDRVDDLRRRSGIEPTPDPPAVAPRPSGSALRAVAGGG